MENVTDVSNFTVVDSESTMWMKIKGWFKRSWIGLLALVGVVIVVVDVVVHWGLIVVPGTITTITLWSVFGVLLLVPAAFCYFWRK